MYLLDSILFIITSLPILYLFVFAIASLYNKKEPLPTTNNARKMLILIPAYKEDNVIESCVKSCILQNYPKNKFDIVVISDQMSKHTIMRLSKLPLILLHVTFAKSTKANSIKFALEQFDNYDIAIVLDADNLIETHFLQKVNAAFEAGYRIVQTHRTAKNLNTNFAIMDAVSEEINNSIFRKGHINLGMSSALIGSGMAFDFNLYKNLMESIESVGGEDKELEHLILLNKHKIHYLHQTKVLDEKIQRSNDFANQRKRWLSAQFEILMKFSPKFIPSLLKGNIDFCDKVFQMAFPPRFLLIVSLMIFTLLATILFPIDSIKWWILCGLLILSFCISVPKHLYNMKLVKAVSSIPLAFILLFKNLLNMKGAGKNFIHTPHGNFDKE